MGEWVSGWVGEWVSGWVGEWASGLGEGGRGGGIGKFVTWTLHNLL